MHVAGEVLAQGAAKRSRAHAVHQPHRRQASEDRPVQEAVQPVQRVGHAHASKVEVALRGDVRGRQAYGRGRTRHGRGRLDPPLDFVKRDRNPDGTQRNLHAALFRRLGQHLEGLAYAPHDDQVSAP